jgi:hypothetical protein
MGILTRKENLCNDLMIINLCSTFCILSTLILNLWRTVSLMFLALPRRRRL